MERLTALAETHAAEPPPLLFDGEPADLEAFGADKPRRIACGDYAMPPPTVRQVIDAESRDPTWGRMFSYHIIRLASGLTDAEMLAMPLPIFCEIEEGISFLLRGLAIRTIAGKLSSSPASTD